MRLALVLAAALCTCSAAQGSFAGKNGLIAFSRSGGADAQPSLVGVDPATGSQRILGTGVEPAWSPDGARLAYVRDGTVFVAQPDGSGATAVGPGAFPAWSPDGSRLAVAQYDGKTTTNHPRGTLQVSVLSLADGSSTQLTDVAADATLPAWSPDGSTIAFATGGALYTVPAAGGAVSPVPVPGVTVDGGPSWSPDGRLLAFIDSGGQVWTTAPDGGSAHQITYTLVPPNSGTARPAWSPDGSAIAFTAGADLCVTDLAGYVRRVTRNVQSAASVIAALPDWQPAASGSGSIFVAPPGRNDSIGCDWNPGVRVEVLDVNVSPQSVSLAAPRELVFVNHLRTTVNVTTTMPGARGAIAPGRFIGFSTVPGEYDFTITGYPDGVPRRGELVVAAAGSVTIAQHAAIRWGTSTVLSGAAAGRAGGTVTLSARAYGATRTTRVATVTPVAGRWQVAVAPRISTTYSVSYEGAVTTRLLRVMPALQTHVRGTTVSVSPRPAAALARQRVFLFRLRGAGWAEFRSARIAGGSATFRGVPAGRYYVAYSGGDAYWSTATDPFTIRR